MENTIKIYCGTYEKYNNGSIAGKWFDLSDYESIEELYTAFKEYHKDEDDPEFMFQDYEVENDLLKDLVGESYLNENVYSFIEAIENASYDTEVYAAFNNYHSIDNYDDVNQFIEACGEAYQGEYDSDKEFVEQLLTETGCIPENMPNYVHIDWESTARDVMMDYHTDSNHYFRCS